MPLKPTKKSKNPPMMSHEFIIQNHGDIVSCVAMVIVMGLLFQASSPLASVFIIMQHMVPAEGDAAKSPDFVQLYTNGMQDIAAVFFYCIIAIVVHAIVQDYILDKVNRKLHLSKTKHSKFNESGQLLLFALFSAAWGLHIVFKDESFTGLSSLWSNYPEDHTRLSFRLKFFFIIQLSYWFHNFPELYFQKTKKDEMMPRIINSIMHIVYIAAAYALNLTHLALFLLILHYMGEATLHASKMLHFAEINKQAAKGFKAYNILFVVCRLVSLLLSILTLQYGLSHSSVAEVDKATGNYNTPLIRLVCLVSVCAIQAWMMYNFLASHLRRKTQRRTEQAAAQKKRQQLARAAKKTKSRASDEDDALLPEVDQARRRK